MFSVSCGLLGRGSSAGAASASASLGGGLLGRRLLGGSLLGRRFLRRRLAAADEPLLRDLPSWIASPAISAFSPRTRPVIGEATTPTSCAVQHVARGQARERLDLLDA